MKSSRSARESNIKLIVGLDEQGSAKGSMYVDDGETFDFRKGRFTRKNFVYENNTLTWSEW